MNNTLEIFIRDLPLVNEINFWVSPFTGLLVYVHKVATHTPCLLWPDPRGLLMWWEDLYTVKP